MAQPALATDAGVILSIGIAVNNDRTEIVIPVATDGAPADVDLAKNAVEDFITDELTDFLACLSEDAEVTFIQGEPMLAGKVPYRHDYAIGDKPGTRTGSALPSQVAALQIYYGDPATAPAPGRARLGKNFIPGISEDDVTGDIISADLFTAIDTITQDMMNGYTATVTWYRVVAANNVGGTPLQNVASAQTRHYVGTQRRRLIPH